MEATKKVTGKSVKKWLGNNDIIVLMLAVSLIVGIIQMCIRDRENTDRVEELKAAVAAL